MHARSLVHVINIVARAPLLLTCVLVRVRERREILEKMRKREN